MLVRWRRPFRFISNPTFAGLCLVAMGALTAAGCSSADTTEPDKSHVVYESDWARPILGHARADQYKTRRYLSDPELIEVKQILRDIAVEWNVTELPSTSPGTRRWVDMDDAVRLACNNSNVATTSKQTIVEGMQYGLLNIVGMPGILVVKRTYDDRIYEARCQIGLFPDLPSNQAYADRLLKELRKSMDALAAQRRRFLQHEAAQVEGFEESLKADK